MRKQKTNNKPIIILLILVVLAASLLGGMIWFLNTHFFVGGHAYPKDAGELDLRDQILSVEEYDRIREALPNGVIHWNIPFQNGAFPEDTTQLTVESLSVSDLERLAYFGNLQELDATGCRDYEEIMALKDLYPNVQVRYTVTIAGTEYPQDAETVTASDLSDEEIKKMTYLSELKHVDASGCTDYKQLAALVEAMPHVDVAYQMELLGVTLTEADVAATFQNPDLDVLMERLASFPHLESLHIVEPAADAQSLVTLMEAYPDVAITWEKTILGKTFHSSLTEYDLTGTDLITDKIMNWSQALDSEETNRMVRRAEEAMRYFPNAEKVIFPGYCVDDEVMAAFREKMRQEYKVVWTVYVTKKPVRTDQEVIHSSAYQVCFIDEQSQTLKYCEDAIVVDIGHSYVKDISWVKGMPKLKYLILTHNWVKDLTPLSTCKELIYLELYWNDHIPDYTPLLGCTALQDLNISGTYADVEPLVDMDWLDNLYANICGLSEDEIQMLEKGLPETNVVAREGRYTGGGWRDLQNYFDMRDIMGLPYNHW